MKKRYNNLTPEDKRDLVKIYHSDSYDSYTDRIFDASSKYGVDEKTIRNWWKRLGVTSKKNEEPEQYKIAKKKKLDTGKSRFIFTWAQNATPVHKHFIENVEAYAKHINASIHVIAGRYKNPTSVFTDKDHDWWADRVVPYLDANRHNIHKDLMIMSDVKIQPTAVNPLSGLEGMSGIDSCIFGSPKVHYRPLPALKGYKPKRMWTTGACTVNNYTDSKAGKKGEFHHVLGFVIVEIQDDEVFYARQVTATDDGDFHDLWYCVSNGEVDIDFDIEALVLGDLHLGDTDDDVMGLTLDFLDIVHPKHVVIHDLFNGHSISHHDLKNPVKMYHKHIAQKDVLKIEINEMLEFLDEMKDYNLVIVRSNHDDFVDRWIINQDWKKDIKNSVEYMGYAEVLLTNKAPKGIIPYIIDTNFSNIKTLDRDESFRLLGVELGSHGDVGSNGARGSISTFRRMNNKVIIGHFHTPYRIDGVVSVGTSTKLRLDYNIGASSWMNTHVVLHTDGKTQHIDMIKSNNGIGFTTLNAPVAR